MTIPLTDKRKLKLIDFDRLESDSEYRKGIFEDFRQRYDTFKYKLEQQNGQVKKMALKAERILDDKTTDIHRQVFIKIASEQIKGKPEELIAYAKNLEELFNNW